MPNGEIIDITIKFFISDPRLFSIYQAYYKANQDLTSSIVATKFKEQYSVCTKQLLPSL